MEAKKNIFSYFLFFFLLSQLVIFTKVLANSQHNCTQYELEKRRSEIKNCKRQLKNLGANFSVNSLLNPQSCPQKESSFQWIGVASKCLLSTPGDYLKALKAAIGLGVFDEKIEEVCGSSPTPDFKDDFETSLNEEQHNSQLKAKIQQYQSCVDEFYYYIKIESKRLNQQLEKCHQVNYDEFDGFEENSFLHCKVFKIRHHLKSIPYPNSSNFKNISHFAKASYLEYIFRKTLIKLSPRDHTFLKVVSRKTKNVIGLVTHSRCYNFETWGKVICTAIRSTGGIAQATKKLSNYIGQAPALKLKKKIIKAN